MIPILKPRQTVRVHEYRRTFDLKSNPRAGYAFACDVNGNVDVDLLTPESRESWKIVTETEKHLYTDQGVTDWSRTFTEYAIGRCLCGKKVELYDSEDGAAECEHCGRLYNTSGQQLRPRDQWEEPYDED